MKKAICNFILRLWGWKSIGNVVPEKKCIIIGVPHTSAWDFVISYLFYAGLGGKAYVLIKKELFVWPIGPIVKSLGGIPIDRSRGANVVRQVVQSFEEKDTLHLALAPEGTRKRTKNWKAGFHSIATLANIPVYLGSFDWGRKEIAIWEEFKLTDDPKTDIRRMKDFYREKGIKGKFPELFTTEY
ncbi:MAG: acyltransferase [Draconibacterium sp.]|nr:MAG: acyltransferase [Draconibacterium sp.]